MMKITLKNQLKKIAFFVSFSLLPFLTACLLVFMVLSPGFGINIPRRYIYIVFLLTIIFSTTFFLWLEKKKTFMQKLRKLLLIFLPVQIIFLFALKEYSLHFNFFIYLFSSFYLITFFVFIINTYLIFRKKEPVDKIEKKSFFSKNISGFIIAIVVAATFFSFGFYHLGKFAAVDEPLWTFNRISKYWSNIFEGEFHKTIISDKPGITVALISGLALNFLDPAEYKPKRENGYLVNPKNDFERFNFLFRLPLLFFTALMIIVFYFFILKLMGAKIALFSVIFIGLSPILLGISTIVNPDALLWVFLPLSVISYFIYLQENRNKFYLFSAGILMGMGLLTKYITNFLIVYFLAIILIEIIMTNKKTLKDFNQHFRLLIIDYLMLILIAFITVFLFLPALWLNPLRFFQLTIWSEAFQKFWPFFLVILIIIIFEVFFLKNRLFYPLFSFFSNKKIWITKITSFLFIFLAFFTFLNVNMKMKWYDFESIIASPKTSASLNNFFGFFTANFYSSIFGVHPIVLVFIFFAIGLLLFTKNISQNLKWIFYIIVFILSYYFASAINMVSATVRYQIVIFPFIFIIAGFGIVFLLNIFKIHKWLFQIMLFFIFVVCFFSLNSIKPHYFSYASSFLPEKYILNLKDMGDGSYEAAQYLNSLKNSENLKIWTDKRGVCYFIKGKCSTEIKLKQNFEFDYFVVSAGRKSRIEKLFPALNRQKNYPIDFRKLYEIEDTVFNLKIGGRFNNYVKIISAEKNKTYEKN